MESKADKLVEVLRRLLEPKPNDVSGKDFAAVSQFRRKILLSLFSDIVLSDKDSKELLDRLRD